MHNTWQSMYCTVDQYKLQKVSKKCLKWMCMKVLIVKTTRHTDDIAQFIIERLIIILIIIMSSKL